MSIKSHAIRPEVTTDSETELNTINTFLQNICRKCTHSFNFHLQLGIDRLECRNALAFGPSDLQCLRNVCQGSRVLTPGSCHETQNESFLWTGDLVGLSEHLLSSTHLVFLELKKNTSDRNIKLLIEENLTNLIKTFVILTERIQSINTDKTISRYRSTMYILGIMAERSSSNERKWFEIPVVAPKSLGKAEADPGFSFGGGGKRLCARMHITGADRTHFRQGSRAHGPWKLWDWFNALTCYLSLIFKHSD